MADRVTRASNASAHPGIVDRAPSRRSKEEVAIAKREKAAAKALAEKKKADNIQRVAQLERDAIRKKKETEQQANDPIDKITRPRVKRIRNQETVNRGTTCHHVRQLTDLFCQQCLAGSKYEETPHTAKKQKTRESDSSNTLSATSQNDSDVLTY